MAYDLVVRGGQVLDGSGLPRFRADVGVIGERIARVGKISERGHREIDAEGLVVTPGFIDGHTHMDAQINWDPLCTSSCHQGVTTVVMGNCGFTLAPSRAENRGWVVRNLERAEDISAEAMAQGIEWGWQTFPEYLDFVDRLPKGLNQSVYVGHSALRTWAMGERAFEAEASADELAAMTQQLRAGVEAGAMGLSTSRSRSHETSDDRPVASRVGAFEEVAALVRTLGELGKGIFEIALGGRTPEELEALAVETRVPMTFGVGAAGGMAWREQLALLDRTAERGGRMIGQTHSRGVTPLLSFEAGLPFDKLPTWRPFRALPLAEQERLLRTDPELRARLVHAAHHEEYPRAVSAEPRRPKWDRVEVRTGPFPPYPNLAALSAEQGRDPMEVMIDLALATPRLSQLFVQTGAPFPDEELLTVLKHPRTVMTFSDSGAHVSQISDCSIHTYLLAYWVRERGAFTLEEAIRMITMTPAAAFGFHDRGLLRQGFAADLNVIDPGAIIPETPRVTTDLPGGAKRFVQGAAGIQATVVNGQVLMEAGVHTGALPAAAAPIAALDRTAPFRDGRLGPQGTLMPPTSRPISADLRLPLLCAPMTMASSKPLTIAACRAGIVGGWQGGNVRTIEAFEGWLTALDEARKESEDRGEVWAPYAINFNASIVNDPDLGEQKLRRCEEVRSPLLITSVGDPTEIIRRAHGWGARVVHDAISIRFAEKAIAAGVDGLMLTCAGAGGHTGQLSPFAFIPKMRQVFDGLIVAAGAIADGAGIAAALTLGADMACMGTRFIATEESGAPDGHKQMIAEAGMEDIIQSDAMNGVNAHWIRQSLQRVGFDPDNLPPKRGRRQGAELPEGVRPWRDIWSAGHSAGLIRDVPTTAEVVERLAAEFEAARDPRDWRARLNARLA